MYKDYKNNFQTSSHCLVELSNRQFERMRKNVIIVSGITDLKDVQYPNIEYGKNIRCQRKKRVHVTNMATDLINISKIKGNYIVIVSPKAEMCRIFPHLHVLYNGDLYQHCPSQKTKSGYVLLFIGATYKSKCAQNYMWDADDFKLLKKCKRNIICKTNSHHGSVGHYFSFGNKANFKITKESSVGTYVTRRGGKGLTNTEVSIMAMQFEKKCATELEVAQNCITKVLPLNRLFLMPIITAAHNEQVNINHSSPLSEPVSSASGCWTTSICVNAETKVLHNEYDCTYTMISAPIQKHIESKYEFNLCLNAKNNISIDMNSGVMFMFSGLFLKHKQYRWFGKGNDLFFNFASYGNNRLFNHLKQTIYRYECGNK